MIWLTLYALAVTLVVIWLGISSETLDAPGIEPGSILTDDEIEAIVRGEGV